MDRDQLLALLQQLLTECLDDKGLNYRFAAVDLNQRGLYVTTAQHEMFLIRVEEQ